MAGPAPLVLGIDYPSRVDRTTHVERICPLPNGESPAWLPSAARWHAPGSRPDLEPTGFFALSAEAQAEIVEAVAGIEPETLAEIEHDVAKEAAAREEDGC